MEVRAPGSPASAPDGRSDVTGSHGHVVPRLFRAAKCILLDFDGPVCDLFHGHPAPRVAAELRGWIKRNVPGEVSVAEGAEDDPLALLRATAEQNPDRDLVREMEQRLTELEVLAARTARPTEGADLLIRGLEARGYLLAITTNNSERAVRNYLDLWDLTHLFHGRIHGRMPNPALMKPNPYCLTRALRSTGVTAAEALMIGDSAADGEAAEKLAVPFLGFGRTASKGPVLRAAGAVEVVPTMSELVPMLDGLDPDLPFDGAPSRAQAT